MAQDAASLKNEGNDKFKAGEYAAAIEAYTRSLELDPSQHLCYSNRSAAYLKLGGSAPEALRDAEKCVELAPEWPKGFSRQAAALQELKRWDEAIAACERGLAASNDDGLRKMLSEVRCRSFQDQLHGAWHGTVSEMLGGYDQAMEFLDESQVKVEVLGRAIVGRYWVDCGPTPHHLNIQVPMTEVPPGMPPMMPPPVPYIAKIDNAGLHICCPFMCMDRPTEFEGPGYCLMTSGPLNDAGASEADAAMSRDERLLACTKELIKGLPCSKLEEPQQTDSEEVAREKMMAQVRFESSMFGVQKRFGEEIMKEVLSAANGNEKAAIPTCLAAAPELKELQQKLQTCGILENEPAAAAPVAAAPAASSAPATRSLQEKPAESKKDGPTPAAPKVERTESAADSSFSPQVICLLSLGAAVATAAAILLWRRQRR